MSQGVDHNRCLPKTALASDLFIKVLDNTGKSPNTIKAYCYHLKLLYEFMEQRGITLNDINIEKLADFVGWLRYPTAANVIDL
ncbi:site-specific integrase [Providencia manganoxydans]|uniref:site-specific integrase n=1 Tax=Providencia manganoxydans TaxID=2923283 RepID=UPI003F70756E